MRRQQSRRTAARTRIVERNYDLRAWRPMGFPYSKEPWHTLATEIAGTLYGPCRREVRLSNNKIADIVPWSPPPTLDERGRVRRATRIIEVKLGHRRSWETDSRKYRGRCRWLEIWCLVTRRLGRGDHLPPKAGIMVRGPYELLRALLARGRSAGRFSADSKKRRVLAKRLWDLKWCSHSSADSLAVLPLRLLLRK